MKIIISPAKKMRIDTDSLNYYQLPHFIEDTEVLLTYLKTLNYEQLKSIWKCSDKIATLNYERIKKMNLYTNLTPTILSFDGIQYNYMAPIIFETKQFEYIQTHLRILSGFYGMLKPFDGVVPYLLEMQAKLNGEKLNSLYDFWNHKLANKLFSETNCIINLASKEYSKCISKFINKNIRFVNCVFGEMIRNKVVEKGTLVKMARGEMVRYMAENQIKDVKNIKKFNRLNYVFVDYLSDNNTFVFVKK